MNRARRTFTTILIANRGEIAVRVIRSARALGYRTVAVYSDADGDAPHVPLADEAVRLGEPPASASYLSIERVMEAARRSHADAVHPGYGFLSENADFARACAENNIAFIGPPASAIELMGNKAAAKRRMREARVPCVPGYDGETQDDATLAREARRIGFPVMVKAAAGGGGRGMRLVRDAAQLAEALRSARAEAQSAFGSDELILERALAGARHVEIQVFADRHGNTIHLGERDCSIQRRHQKVIEEAPSPAVSPELRERMGDAAVAAARAVGYEGAGTVEFLLDEDARFYFLEMNTRLQVEHPVTETVTGLDLVAWQIRIAAGERLALAQADVRLSGHAIEARLYAEDPAQGFLPQTGRVLVWEPPSGDGIRVDHGVRTGFEITPHYDAMIAKIIAYGETREDARRRLIRALTDTAVLGVPTNRGFLIDCLAHPVFAAGEATTAFIDMHLSELRTLPAENASIVHALGAVLLYRCDVPPLPPALVDWRSTGPAPVPLLIDDGTRRLRVEVTAHGNGEYRVSEQKEHTVRIVSAADGRARCRIDGIEHDARFAFDAERLHLAVGSYTAQLQDRMLASPESLNSGARDGRVVAAMNGTVTAIHVRVDEAVRRGQALAIVEAMKMQHVIAAPVDGIVRRVAVAVGKPVASRELLLELEPQATAEQAR
ncbi:MAG: acetyl/propionyl/methylcrotonyl-CoA carboxylase subunit alpha [Sulfurifustaceae bacterium]